MAGPKACDVRDRHDAAWHAIAETLLTADEPPTVHDLRYAGMAAVNLTDRQERRHHGLNRDNDDAERFAWYWWQRATPSHEGRVTERAPLTAIRAALSPLHRQVLTALAVHEDHQAAAQACGKSYACYLSHLRNARRAFLVLWHEGETPSRFWGKGDRRHGSAPATALIRKRAAMRRAREARRAA